MTRITPLKTLTKLGLPGYLTSFARRYFQLEVLGEEHVPFARDGNMMLAMNHTAFFGLEAYLLGGYLLARDPELDFTTLVWRALVRGPAASWFRLFGCREAKVEIGARLLKDGRSVLILPQGLGCADVRQRFTPFHTGFLRMLAQHPVPLVPVGFYGVDEAIPWWVTHNRWLVETFMKPVDAGFDFFLIPKPLSPRPTKIVFAIGQPIHYQATDLDSEEKIQEQTRHVQKVVEKLVDRAGKHRRLRIEKSPLNKAWHRWLEGRISLLDEPRR